MVDFPEALWGVTFREAAGFIFDTTHAVLLAVEAKSGKDRNCLVLGSLEQVRRCTRAVPVVCSSAHSSLPELIGERVPTSLKYLWLPTDTLVYVHRTVCVAYGYADVGCCFIRHNSVGNILNAVVPPATVSLRSHSLHSCICHDLHSYLSTGLFYDPCT